MPLRLVHRLVCRVPRNRDRQNVAPVSAWQLRVAAHRGGKFLRLTVRWVEAEEGSHVWRQHRELGCAAGRCRVDEGVEGFMHLKASYRIRRAGHKASGGSLVRAG